MALLADPESAALRTGELRRREKSGAKDGQPDGKGAASEAEMLTQGVGLTRRTLLEKLPDAVAQLRGGRACHLTG